jgi:hypothetical protein
MGKHALQDGYPHLPVGEVGDLSLILVSTGCEGGFGSYTAKNLSVNRMERRIWIPTQNKILVILE